MPERTLVGEGSAAMSVLRACPRCGQLNEASHCPGHGQAGTGQRGSTRADRKERREILEAANWTCIYCADQADTVDHYIPLSLGGTNDRANKVAACTRCNTAKGELMPSQFMGELENGLNKPDARGGTPDRARSRTLLHYLMPVKPLRTIRLLACGFFDNLETFAGYMADALAVKPYVAFENNEQIDAPPLNREDH